MSKKWWFYTGLTLIVLVISSGFKPYTFKHLDWFHTNDSDELIYTVPTAEESEYVNIIFPKTGKTFAGFKQAIAFKESQGKYHLINSLGYMGKYQFGTDALNAIGVRDSLRFMNSPKLQEKAFNSLLSLNKYLLKNEIKKYSGKKIKGILITESGILAAAHLGGAGSVKKFLKSNGNRYIKDDFGTSLRSYLKKFGGYDTSYIKANRNAKVKM